MENSIKIILYKPQLLDEITINYTTVLAKILLDKISIDSMDNYIKMIETTYADEISPSGSNITKGDKNEYGCDLHEKV